jgi:CheY-like chemotaxis protein
MCNILFSTHSAKGMADVVSTAQVGQAVASRKIIVIDDDVEILNLLKTVLKTKGYITYTATNGEEGLRLISEKKPDLVIVDLMMPIVSGLEVCKQLRRDPEFKTIPIIVISGIGKESGKSEDFWRIGLQSDDFLSKPFDPLDLLGRVEFIFRRDAYLSTRPDSAGKVERVVVDLEQAEPPDVVKSFVESWNSADFLTEYNCLADEMRGGLNVKEYIARRKQTYLDEHGIERKQRVLRVIESKVSHNVASVTLERDDTVRGHSQTKRETYVLRKAANGWKIVTVRIKQPA